MILEIEGRDIKTASDVHDKLKNCPGMPEFYGRNFDAFFDVLTGFIELPFKIIWTNASISRSNLGNDYAHFLLTMRDAVRMTASYPHKFEFEIIE